MQRVHKKIKISDIVEVLSTPYRQHLDSTILQVFSGIETHTSQIKAVSAKAVQYDQIPCFTNEVHDLQRVVDEVYMNETNQLTEAIEQLQPLFEMRYYINRIDLCFAISKLINPRGYQIVSAKLCDGMKYDVIVSMFHIHRNNIKALERKELRLIAILYAISGFHADIQRTFENRISEKGMTLDEVVAVPEQFLTKEEMNLINRKEYWEYDRRK